MLNTSRDLLNVLLAVSIFGISVFICFLLYYMAVSIRQFYKIAKDLRLVIDDAGKVVKVFREKAEGSISYMLLMGEGIKTVLEYVKDKEGIGKKRASKKGNTLKRNR